MSGRLLEPTSDLTASLGLVGVAPLIRFPIPIVRGPVLFKGSIPDNTTTSVDLTLNAAVPDPRIQQFFGSGDDKDVVAQIDGVQLQIFDTIAGETEAVVRQLLENIYLQHTMGTDTFKIPLAKAIGFGISMKKGTTDATFVHIDLPEPMQLDQPLLVYFKNDGLSLEFVAATDLSAALSFQLWFYGAFWPSSAGAPEITPISSRSIAASVRESRARNLVAGMPAGRPNLPPAIMPVSSGRR